MHDLAHGERLHVTQHHSQLPPEALPYMLDSVQSKAIEVELAKHFLTHPAEEDVLDELGLRVQVRQAEEAAQLDALLVVSVVI